MKIFVGHVYIRKASVIVKKNGIIGYWSPEMLRIPVCLDILSGIVVISLTFLVFSLIFDDSFGFPWNYCPWIYCYLADMEASYSS